VYVTCYSDSTFEKKAKEKRHFNDEDEELGEDLDELH
jgi:hypothetical protein